MSGSDLEESPSVPGVVRRSNTADLQSVSAGDETEMQVLLGPADGVPNFAMRKFVMADGGGMPRHTNEVEHEQYVLTGRARITIGDRSFDVEAGDAVFIPAGTPHSYSVIDGPFEFLCLVPNREDAIRILDDGC